MIFPVSYNLLFHQLLEVVLGRGVLKQVEGVIKLIEEAKSANLLKPGVGSDLGGCEDMPCMDIERVLGEMTYHHEQRELLLM